MFTFSPIHYLQEQAVATYVLLDIIVLMGTVQMYVLVASTVQKEQVLIIFPVQWERLVKEQAWLALMNALNVRLVISVSFQENQILQDNVMVVNLIHFNWRIGPRFLSYLNFVIII